MSLGATQEALVADQLIGNYRITRELGRGGMGVVYAAEHQHIGRRAAIKVLNSEFSQNPSFATRFLNEARVVNLIQHPGLVEIYEHGVLPDGAAYIIMEYLEGESLRQRINERPGWVRRNAPGILYQLALALSAAHEKDVVHRDLKPENIMVVADRGHPRDERIKILDFGIAKLAPGGSGPISGPKTTTGSTMGTAEYMSPEQCMAQVLDGKSDTYALGVILYEMLGGDLPFRAQFGFEVMRLHVYEKPRPLRSLNPEVPEAAAALVERMLAKDPAARPSMPQLIAEIERIWQDLSLRAPSSTDTPLKKVPADALGPTVPSDHLVSPRPQTPKEVPAALAPTGQVPQERRRLGLAAALGIGGALLLVLGAISLWFALGKEPRKQPTVASPPQPPAPAPAPADVPRQPAPQPQTDIPRQPQVTVPPNPALRMEAGPAPPVPALYPAPPEIQPETQPGVKPEAKPAPAPSAGPPALDKAGEGAPKSSERRRRRSGKEKEKPEPAAVGPFKDIQ
jgi:serine/threonine-protein kinase